MSVLFLFLFRFLFTDSRTITLTKRKTMSRMERGKVLGGVNV